MRLVTKTLDEFLEVQRKPALQFSHHWDNCVNEHNSLPCSLSLMHLFGGLTLAVQFVYLLNCFLFLSLCRST